MFIPEINFNLKNRSYDSNLKDPTVSDSVLTLKNGEIICGMFDKSIMGISSGGLLHCIWLEFGA